MGYLHATAENIVTLLNAESFSKEFTAALDYDTNLKLESAGTLDVAVVPAAIVQLKDSRTTVEYQIQIDIAVRYHFAADEMATGGGVDVDVIEPYIDLLEEIADALAAPSNRVLASPGATWVNNEIRFPWVPSTLREDHQYTGILRCTYRSAADLGGT